MSWSLILHALIQQVWIKQYFFHSEENILKDYQLKKKIEKHNKEMINPFVTGEPPCTLLEIKPADLVTTCQLPIDLSKP